MDDPNVSAAAPAAIDLSELDLAPSWVSRVGDGTGQVVWENRGSSGQGGGHGGERRGRFGGGDRDRGDRGAGDRGGPRGPGAGRDFRGRSDGPRPAGPGGGRSDRGPRTGNFERRDRDDAPPAPMPPPPGWEAVLLPEPAGIETLAVQIKATGRAYAVFDLAKLFLAKRERCRLRFQPGPDAQPPVLTLCAVDGSLWISRDEAKRHFSQAGLITRFFREEKVQVDPPKGVFTAVAVCGLSGTVLGPPNFHGYQSSIVHLHQDRFKTMPLDRFKSRIRIERDDEAVKKWIDEQSTQTRYTLLEGGDDAPVFKSADEALRHLFETRESELFADAPSATIPGQLPNRLLSPALVTLLRLAAEQQRRFPMQLVQELCKAFEQAGLRFFKENKRETYVARSRPRPLDPGMAVSDRVRTIVQFIREHPKCNYQAVIAGLVTKSNPIENATAAAPDEGAGALHLPGNGFTLWIPKPQPKDGLIHSPEETPWLQDLRWLIREGYVTEFPNGHLRVVERLERPKPEPRPEQKPAVAAAPAAASESNVSDAAEKSDSTPEVPETEPPAPTLTEPQPAADHPDPAGT